MNSPSKMKRTSGKLVPNKQIPPPAYDLALAWYVWVSHVLYAFAALRLRALEGNLPSGADESQPEKSERSEG